MSTEEKEDLKQKPTKTNDRLSIVAFLSLEVLALTAFTFTGSILTYAILGVALFLGIIISSFREIKKDGLLTSIYFFIPLFVYSLMLAVSNFKDSSNSSFSPFEKVFIPFMLVAFSGCGYYFRYFKAIKISTIFTVIYSALALYTVIGFAYSMIQFTPFYPFIYSNSYLYYNGRPSSVAIGDMAYSLMGFSMYEVSIEYFILFPSLLLTSVIALFYISPKSQTRTFVLYCVFTFVAVLALAFMSNVYTLLTSLAIIALIAVVLCYGKLKLKYKPIVIVLYVVGALLGLWFLSLLILSQSELAFLDPVRNFISSIPFVGKIMLLGRYRAILDGLFTSSKIFGFAIIESGVNLSNSWLFDSAMMSGLLGFIALLVFVVFAIVTLLRFFVRSKETIMNKSLLLAFVFAFIGYTFVNGDSTPYVNYSNVIPIWVNGPGLIALFLIGYATVEGYLFSKHKEVEEKPVVEVNEYEKTID